MTANRSLEPVAWLEVRDHLVSRLMRRRVMEAIKFSVKPEAEIALVDVPHP